MAGTIDGKKEELPLSKAVETLLEECRMVLPGIQALFGFQLMVVFNDGFETSLGAGERYLHLGAIALIVIAIALIMTPAALHRQSHPRQVSSRLVALSTRLMLVSMVPLCVGVCLDVYLVARVILHSRAGAVPAALLFLLFVLLWFVLPRSPQVQALVTPRHALR